MKTVFSDESSLLNLSFFHFVKKINLLMAALFKFSDSSKIDEKFQYTQARTSSDDGEGSLSSDGLLEKDATQFSKKHSILRRYAPLIILHFFICFLYLVLLYLVASSYASSRRLNGPGVVLCRYKSSNGFRVYTDAYSTGTGSDSVRRARLYTRR